MEIDFDPSKSETNHKERGFGLGYAARIFLGRTLVSFAQVERGEIRIKAVAEIDGVVYAVIFVEEDDVRRIISARPASRRERREWLASE